MPNRILSGHIATSESLSHVRRDAILTFVLLISVVDDYGRFDARPRALLAALFGLRDDLELQDLEQWLEELEGEGLISRYKVEGRPYLWLPAWGKYQREGRSRSKWPEPPELAATRGNSPQTAATGCDSRPETETKTDSESHTETKTDRVVALPDAEHAIWARLAAASPIPGVTAEEAHCWGQLNWPSMLERGVKRPAAMLASWWKRLNGDDLRTVRRALANRRTVARGEKLREKPNGEDESVDRTFEIPIRTVGGTS